LCFSPNCALIVLKKIYINGADLGRVAPGGGRVIVEPGCAGVDGRPTGQRPAHAVDLFKSCLNVTPVCAQAEAETWLLTALKTLETAFDATHLALCEVLDRLAELHTAAAEQCEGAPHRKALAACVQVQARSLAIKELHLGPTHPAVPEGHYNLAQVYFQLGDTVNATKHLAAAVETASAIFGPDHPLTEAAREKLEFLQHAK
jgi:hypothetical protein